MTRDPVVLPADGQDTNVQTWTNWRNLVHTLASGVRGGKSAHVQWNRDELSRKQPTYSTFNQHTQRDRKVYYKTTTKRGKRWHAPTRDELDVSRAQKMQCLVSEPTSGNCEGYSRREHLTQQRVRQARNTSTSLCTGHWRHWGVLQ